MKVPEYTDFETYLQQADMAQDRELFWTLLFKLNLDEFEGCQALEVKKLYEKAEHLFTMTNREYYELLVYDYHAGKVANSWCANAWATAIKIREKIYGDEVSDRIDEMIEEGLIIEDSDLNCLF